MFLKKLSIHGFKSFADRTTLEFEPGITGIVGPNGSGKSNIADALRWILGEQRIKNLRGAKLEDVIFAGSQGSKAVGMAEVTMYLDNSQGRLDLDYAEVAVTRRVFRSGESDFLINNSACRLRDIQELFMDTGVGRDAYCILGQGDIDTILSPNSEDRRRFFEEAAGVVKFRVRKQEAQRRLGETEANLTRLDDILHEIRGQLGPLARQAKKAERYREYQERLRSFESIIFAFKYDLLKRRLAEIQGNVDKLQEEVALKSAGLSSAEASVEARRLQLTALEKELERLRLEDLETTRRLEQVNSELLVAKEKITRWVQDKERNQSELEDLVRQITEKEDTLGLKEAALAEASQDQEGSKTQAQEAARQVEAARRSVQNKLEEISSLEAQLRRVGQEVTDVQTQIARARSRGEQAQQEQIRLQEELNLLLAEMEEARSEYSQRELELQATEARAKAMQEAKEEKNIRGRELVQELAANEARLEKAKDEQSRVSSELKALEDLEARGEDLFAGVRRVIQAWNSGKLPGIIGVVADLLEVPVGFEVAIETALGSNIQCLVSEDDQSAEEAINWLKAERAGRATFLPLNIISGRPIPAPELQTLSSIPGFIGLASELVGSKEGLTELKTYLLGRSLIAKDLTTARQIAKNTRYRYQVVTKEGEIIRPGGSMTGGSTRQNGGGLLARKGRIKELQAQQEALVLTLSQQQDEVSRVREELTRVRELIDGLDQEIQEFRVQKATLQRELENSQKSIRSYENRQEQLTRRQQELKSQEPTQALLALEEAEVQAKNKRALLEEQLEQERHQLQSDQEILDDLRSKAAQVGTAQAILKEKYERFLAEVQQIKTEIAALGQREEVCRQRLTEAQKGISLAEETQEEAKMEQEVLAQNQQKLSGEYQAKREEREAFQSQLAETENQLRVMRRQVNECTNLLHETQLDETKVQGEHRALLDRYWETYELDESAIADLDLAETSLEEAEQEVAQVQSKLKMLGPINPEAEAEYQSAKERHDFLTSQYEDLNKAKDDLYNVIADIEANTEEQFAKAFDLIQAEFKGLFQRLFGGGEAYLTLTDPNNLNETGVEILAQPPGKRMQNLALLSSGERSLTAIALLMAILKVNPAPFTVLDEVDAALDDANLERFADLLKEFSERTQFIIITHRRRTMEAAQVLYGVTMQKNKGYSEVVSVKLSDVE